MNLNELNQQIPDNTLRFLKKYVIRTLRRYWRYWPARNEAFNLAKIDRANYQCNICKQTGFKREQLQVDHINPVQNLEHGLKTWYDLIMFIKNLYVPATDLQLACIPCHQIKSNQEAKMRKYYRDLKKKQDNE